MNVFHMNVCAVFYLQNALPVLQIHLTVNIQLVNSQKVVL